MATLTYRGSRADLDRLLRAVPLILAGRLPDPLGITRLVAFRMANSLLSVLTQDLMVLSRGGTSRDGRKWALLAPATIEKRLPKAIKAARRRLRQGRGKPADSRLNFSTGPDNIPIGRDTARMFRSLAAAVMDEFANPDTVFEVTGGTLTVGTNCTYAEPFHRGRPGKQPARPLAPADGVLPAVYWDAVLAAGIRGITAAIELMVRQGYRPT